MTMKISELFKFSITILCMVFCLASHSQSIEIGYVKEYNGKNAKTPLGGVELNVSGAPSTVSDAQGRYELKFAVLKAGEVVHYNDIYKSGFVIFNSEALKAWRISNNKTPFVIVMCKENEFRALKKKFYGLIEKSYKQEYEKQKAATKAAENDMAALQRKFDELERIYQEKMSNINTYVEVFSRIDQSEMTEIESEALRLVEEGRIEDGIKKYEELDLQNKSAEQLAKFAAGQEIVRAGQEMIDAAHTDLLSLAEKLKTQVGLYEMGSQQHSAKKRECIGQLVTIFTSLHQSFGNIYNNELGKWMVQQDRYNIENLKKAAALPSYDGLYALGEAYECYSIREDSLYDKAIECYKKALTLHNPEDSINLARERLRSLPDFSIKAANTDIYFRITSEEHNKVSICPKSLIQSNAPEGELVIPAKVDFCGRKYFVTGIDDYAFYNDTLLTSATIPSTIKHIGKEAFYRTSLKRCEFRGEIEDITDNDSTQDVIPLETILVLPANVKSMYKWLILRQAKRYEYAKYQSDSEESFVALTEYLANHKESDWEDKIDYYEELARLYSDKSHETYNVEKARMYYEKMYSLIGELPNKEDKVEYYGEMVELFSDSSSVIFDIDRAWNTLEHIIRIDKESQGACYETMGKLCMMQNQYDKAHEYFIMAYDKKHYSALNELAYLYAQGKNVEQDYKKAHELIDEAIFHVPHDWNLLDSKGEFYLMQGDTINARKYCDSALSKIKEIGIFVDRRTREYKSSSILFQALYGYSKEEASENTAISTLSREQLQQYINVVQAVAKLELIPLLEGNSLITPEYEELVSIGIIALQVLIKNKTPEQLKRYNLAYIATATRWAIRSELGIRYLWYRYYLNKKGVNEDEKNAAIHKIDLSRLNTLIAVYKTTFNICNIYDNLTLEKEGMAELLDISRIISSLQDTDREIVEKVLRIPNSKSISDIASDYHISWLEAYKKIAHIFNTLNKAIKTHLNDEQNGNRQPNNELIQKYSIIAETMAKMEHITSKIYIDYSELCSIGEIAVQVMIKSKTEEQLAKYNNIYIATAIQWAIRNELRIRNKYYHEYKIITGKDSLLTDSIMQKYEVRFYTYRVIGDIYNYQNSIEDTAFKTEILQYASIIKKTLEDSIPQKDKKIIQEAIFTDYPIDSIAEMNGISLHNAIININNGLNIIKEKLNSKGLFGY